jgi:hypothetical protein
MSCKSCGSVNEEKFRAEINLHFPGYEGPEKPTVWLFQEVMVCLGCGFTEFSIPDTELGILAKDPAA